MFVGDIPEFDEDSPISYVDVSHNALNGTLPDAWLSNANLRYFSAAFNQLTGTIPGLQTESSQLLSKWPQQCESFLR